jgi:hypothetical protein
MAPCIHRAVGLDFRMDEKVLHPFVVIARKGIAKPGDGVTEFIGIDRPWGQEASGGRGHQADTHNIGWG